MTERICPETRRLLAEFFCTGKRLSYKRNATILTPQQMPEGIYYIDSGFVQVYSQNARAEQHLHIVYGPTELFPLVWLANKTQRNVYYQALSPVTLYCMPQEQVDEALKSHKQLAYHLLRQALFQFNLYTDRVDNLEYKYASERLIYRLLFLAGRFGEKRGSGLALPHFFTQRTIGSSINLSRESVSREMDKLVAQGLLVYEGRTIIIKNLAKLCQTFKRPIRNDWWGLVDHDSLGE